MPSSWLATILAQYTNMNLLNFFSLKETITLIIVLFYFVYFDSWINMSPLTLSLVRIIIIDCHSHYHNLIFTAVSMWTMIWYNCFYRCSGGPWFDVIGSDWCSETELKFFLSTFAKWHELVVGLFRTEKIRGEICRGTRTIETALGYWLTDWLTATLDLQKKEQ